MTTVDAILLLTLSSVLAAAPRGTPPYRGLDRGEAAHLAGCQRPGLVRAAPFVVPPSARRSVLAHAASRRSQDATVAGRLRASQLATAHAAAPSSSPSALAPGSTRDPGAAITRHILCLPGSTCDPGAARTSGHCEHAYWRCFRGRLATPAPGAKPRISWNYGPGPRTSWDFWFASDILGFLF